jgi:TonB family protein
MDEDDLLHRRAARPSLDPTRATPETWFVGSGTGLMIAVLVACGILILVRAASMIWMAEEAWRWWHQPSAVASRLPTREPASLPPNRIPPVDPAKARLPLRGNPGAAFVSDAYPDDALRNNEQGRTVAVLTVDASGTPSDCVVKTSSGSQSLDKATCRVALRRVRFEPARDKRGAPIPSHYTLPVRWVLPKD